LDRPIAERREPRCRGKHRLFAEDEIACKQARATASTRAGDLEVEHRILAGARSDRSAGNSRSGTGDHARHGETYGPLAPTLPGKFNMGTPVSLDVPYSYKGLLVLVNRGRDRSRLTARALHDLALGFRTSGRSSSTYHPSRCLAMRWRVAFVGGASKQHESGSSTVTASPGTADGSRVR
jgi:hypothetical protein